MSLRHRIIIITHQCIVKVDPDMTQITFISQIILGILQNSDHSILAGVLKMIFRLRQYSTGLPISLAPQ